MKTDRVFVFKSRGIIKLPDGRVIRKGVFFNAGCLPVVKEGVEYALLILLDDRGVSGPLKVKVPFESVRFVDSQD